MKNVNRRFDSSEFRPCQQILTTAKVTQSETVLSEFFLRCSVDFITES